MSNIYKKRIESLRTLMRENNLDAYYVPMNDCHLSEYVGEHFKAIQFLSGFTGSAANLLVTEEESFLWTDGRYFIQADKELAGSGIRLMKSGEKGVPAISEYINKKLGEKGRLGFDGSVVTPSFAKKIKCRTSFRKDLTAEIWYSRPEQRFSGLVEFERYSGENTVNKLKKLRAALNRITKEDYIHVINSLDDIAWIFNFRADDIAYNPVAYAYAVITRKEAVLYLGTEEISSEIKVRLKKAGVNISDYKKFRKNFIRYIKNIAEHRAVSDENSNNNKAGNKADLPVIILDCHKISYDMYEGFMKKGFNVIDRENPSSKMKSVKNKTEKDGIRACNLKDGAALTEFIMWLKNHVKDGNITEYSAALKLEEFRKKQKGFMGPSFETISAYRENGAIIHYAPEKGKDKVLKPEGFLLVDSGGHYLEGTTDITRTIALGPLKDKEKKYYTIVAASMLRTMNLNARNTDGAFSGVTADSKARELLQKEGEDFRHGTGHGIGHVLNVHELPPVLTKKRPGNKAANLLKEGQLTSVEPGVYFKDEFGVRIENNVLVVKEHDETGEYLAFENVTFVPLDVDAIDAGILSSEDIDNINNYNKSVYNALKNMVNGETAEWLKINTAKL